MKIAILGGGFTGLSAAYYLQKKGHVVTLFEKETVLGGLAAGFRAVNWEWHLERSYHHLFSNDI
ncbi:FAD-dependent oxidoreductase, partial [Candidatus Roizmanbacteria bacterium]|nr:FAD-dependent oxidoreductase [Candidatus Roizmanbacteria bacterium]